MYSKLIHTVDHVEGYLRDGFDALDAFLCHTWAVTVTGIVIVIIPMQIVLSVQIIPSHVFGDV